MRFAPNSLFFVLSVLAGCGGSGRDGTDGDADSDSDVDADADGDDCVDLDGDGAGEGSDCAADDCDDTDPATTDECGTDCDTHPQRRGCPCTDGVVSPCYHGPQGTGNVGTCSAGLQRCEDGALGPCDDQVLPIEELCDELDNDCDGEVDDDGVLSECGSCGPCEQHCAGPEEGCEDFQEEEESGGVAETAEGWLVLDGTASNLHVMWPSSSGSGQVLRVDTETFEILGAYWTGPEHGDGGWFGGDSPSRTAVDDYGSVVIANRAFGAQASITKVASSEELCVDSNGNGVVDTSHGWDELLDFSSHEDWDDECILWHTTVGDMNDAIARAVAIHTVVGLDGVAVDRGWVGMYTERRFLEFDEVTGELTGTEAATADCTPYGGALDRDGWLWTTCLTNIVGRFDTASPEDSYESFAMPGMGQAYRVIVDENNAPWVSGNDAFRYDRDTEEFVAVGLAGGGFGFVGNIASDGEGSLWVGTYTDGQYVHRIANDDTLEHHTVDTPGVNTFGTAVDFDRHAWTFGYTDGTAAVIDIDTEEVQHVFDTCNGPCLNMPYVRGDITGLQRRNALNPNGTFTRLVEGCEAGADTEWGRIVIDAETPAGSNLVVSVRTSDDLGALAALEWITVGVVPDDGNDLDLADALDRAGVEPGHYLAVQVRLQSLDRVTSPTLRRVDVQWGCEGMIE